MHGRAVYPGVEEPSSVLAVYSACFNILKTDKVLFHTFTPNAPRISEIRPDYDDYHIYK